MGVIFFFLFYECVPFFFPLSLFFTIRQKSMNDTRKRDSRFFSFWHCLAIIFTLFVGGRLQFFKTRYIDFFLFFFFFKSYSVKNKNTEMARENKMYSQDFLSIFIKNMRERKKNKIKGRKYD